MEVTCWDILRKSKISSKNLGPEYYAYYDLKRYGKLPIAATLLGDEKDAKLKVCAFLLREYFKQKGNCE